MYMQVSMIRWRKCTADQSLNVSATAGRDKQQFSHNENMWLGDAFYRTIPEFTQQASHGTSPRMRFSNQLPQCKQLVIC